MTIQKEFNDLFEVSPDRRLTPRQAIKIGGVMIGPGITFSPGVYIAGVDITNFIGHNIEVQDEGGMLSIIGFY